eukprot:CAMPEP_0197534532 /NCGR_PEP_ID=MMETSP1318-20131121/47506_1 /TAXON_ID=552666 /ORGANISM="Partenskyella glossopodia, Strain RCC365" /LENGTH=404 /DNA_ID=CAMNT_0043091845 /DNA_START=42 /DNA_END=1256 /DNA_ORIENTATION=-
MIATVLLLCFLEGEAVLSNKQGSLEQKPQRRSVLILKQARTGSTWFCEEANNRGLHISQESMLNWDHFFPGNKTMDDFEEYFTKESRLAWVEQSLTRPMPKNPFAQQDGCSRIRKAAAETKKGLCATLDENACAPPFKKEACSDFHGCFHQWSAQNFCMHDSKEPSLLGTSFSYSSEFGDVNSQSVEHAKLLKDVVDKVRKSGVDVQVLTQSRSNVVHWALSKKFHSYKNRDPADKVKSEWEYTKDHSKLIIHDPEKFFIPKLVSASEIVEHSRHVDGGDSALMFYEDIGRNINSTIDALLKLFEPKTTHQTEATFCNNCQNQHPQPPADYIENIDEVLNKMKKYPCIVRQLRHENKYDTFILPYVLDKHGKFRMDLSKDCCVAESSTYIRSIDDYIKSYSTTC